MDIYGFLPNGHTQTIAFWATIVFWIIMLLLTPKIICLFLSLKTKSHTNMNDDNEEKPEPEKTNGQSNPQIFSGQNHRIGSFFSNLVRNIKYLKNLPTMVGILGIFLIAPMALVFIVLGNLPAFAVGGGITQGTFWTGLVTTILIAYTLRHA